ncbi:hypothetical protein E6O75_ATG06805 [Venturia nashicola]|uniref:Uncharacterized protein n=1 Tax=Venturia nashicola TaxID=86259 RepID=A0A4Z1PAM6_9PEZI|nr:hypothetical protein E6O75_ATG06805 [Venturia nashicola]
MNHGCEREKTKTGGHTKQAIFRDAELGSSLDVIHNCDVNRRDQQQVNGRSGACWMPRRFPKSSAAVEDGAARTGLWEYAKGICP